MLPQGDIVFNPDDLAKSLFRVRIKAESINTDNESRDEHLKEETYFDVKNYPMIRFVSVFRESERQNRVVRDHRYFNDQK